MQGKPWKVVSRKQDDKWHLTKFRTASMEVTMTKRGDGAANETVQDAMQQRQVRVFCLRLQVTAADEFASGADGLSCLEQHSPSPHFRHSFHLVSPMESTCLESRRAKCTTLEPCFHSDLSIPLEEW